MFEQAAQSTAANWTLSRVPRRLSAYIKMTRTFRAAVTMKSNVFGRLYGVWPGLRLPTFRINVPPPSSILELEIKKIPPKYRQIFTALKDFTPPEDASIIRTL